MVGECGENRGTDGTFTDFHSSKHLETFRLSLVSSFGWQGLVFILNLNDFYRHIVGVFVRMRSLPRVPQHKRRLLLFVFLHLARVEDKFPVRVSDDCVANLLDIQRTRQTNVCTGSLLCGGIVNGKSEFSTPTPVLNI